MSAILMKQISKTNLPELSRPRRVLLYGTHGIGKSTFGACAPSPIFLRTEDGLQDIDTSAFPLATTFADVMQAIYELRTTKHNFKTCVLDSADWLEEIIKRTVCNEGGKDTLSDFGFGKGYDAAAAKFKEVLDQLAQLNVERQMLVIILAHCKIERFEDPRTEAYDRYSPKLHKHVNGTIQEWADEVLFTNYKVFTRKDGTGFNERKLGVGSGERVIYTNEKPAHLAKNRLGLPDEIPLAFAEYWKYAGGKDEQTEPVGVIEKQDSLEVQAASAF
jgi:hypothetical protein